MSEVPITFWACTRQTARPFQEELFLFLTPANPGAIVKNIIEDTLHKIQNSRIFDGLEPIPEYAFPICQLFRGKIIRFYYSAEDVEECYLPAFKWSGGAPAFSLSTIDKSAIMLENHDSEILFMRANVSSVMNGEYYRKLQQSLNCIGREE